MQYVPNQTSLFQEKYTLTNDRYSAATPYKKQLKPGGIRVLHSSWRIAISPTFGEEVTSSGGSSAYHVDGRWMWNAFN